MLLTGHQKVVTRCPVGYSFLVNRTRMKRKEIPLEKEAIERFKSYLPRNKTALDCWFWQGSITSNGYGKFNFQSKPYLAHRFSFAYFVQKPSNTLVIDHICENRNCVNPNHLRELTINENALRNYRKPYTTQIAVLIIRGICKHGHKINSYKDLVFNEHWRCKECRKIQSSTKDFNFEKSLLLKKGLCVRGHRILNRVDLNKRGRCKKCVSEDCRKWSIKNPDYFSQWYARNSRSKSC